MDKGNLLSAEKPVNEEDISEAFARQLRKANMGNQVDLKTCPVHEMLGADLWDRDATKDFSVKHSFFLEKTGGIK